MNIYLCYVLCVATTANLLCCWFNTSLPNHFFGKRDASFDELIDGLSKKSEFFSDLLSCPYCLGTWVAAFVAAILASVGGLSPWFIPACQFSVPLLAVRLGKL